MKRVISIIMASSMLLSAVCASAADIDAVTAIAEGTARGEVYAAIGRGEASPNGYKETYRLSNGQTAVLAFVDDVFNCGFVLVN